jgi:transposase InsO family protein
LETEGVYAFRSKENPVKLHGNARLTPGQRRLLCQRIDEERWTVADAAEAAGISERRAYEWLRRWREGDRVLEDRSSTPKRIANRTPVRVEAVIERLRRLRMTSTTIAAKLRMAVSTVGAVLLRIGLHRLSRLEPLEPPNRYCRRHPGELIHIDIKKLGRFDRPGHRVTGRGAAGTNTRMKTGWECCHVAIDDTSRVAYVEILPNQTAKTCVEFLERALIWFAARGVTVQRIMTDNGSGYRSKLHARTVTRLGIKHLFTRPYRPRTNGKAERFIQTLLREWAYAVVYRTSQHRGRALTPWLNFYNHQRPHGALGHQAPASRLPAAA